MGKIVPLFPEKMIANPGSHPIIKALLDDIRAATEPASMTPEESGEVTVIWKVGDETVILTIDAALGAGHIQSVDDDENELMSAVIHVGESNRWAGYYIDDRS